MTDSMRIMLNGMKDLDKTERSVDSPCASTQPPSIPAPGKSSKKEIGKILSDFLNPSGPNNAPR